ncbi:MAG TPA: hypothetical protein VNK04_04380 [Gemmataceae bacterium]|jgi:hypothetical protein|nr:hypothetical protein [Gemmataceae bacterium]
MRSLFLSVVLGMVALGILGLTPSDAQARWWRAPVVSYYYPVYSYYYTPAFYPPGYVYSSYYVAPAYYPVYTTYYYTPGYVYTSGYRVYYPAPVVYYWW